MKRPTLSDELVELRRIMRHYRPMRRLLRATAEFAALVLFIGGMGYLALGLALPTPATPPVMMAEAQ